jgi:hypothetical protein
MTWPQLHVKQLNARQWELLADFTWEGRTVPKGFVTDAASIPRSVWWWVRPEGIFPAAVLHDWDYHECGEDGALTRKQSNNMLRIHVRALGFGKVKARLISWGPKLWGWVIWNRYLRAKHDACTPDTK